MSDWERCLAQEADEFAEAEAQDAAHYAMLMAEWQELEEAKAADRWELWMTPPVADEWDENEYDYQ